MKKFKIGDSVIGRSGDIKGLKGTVVAIDYGQLYCGVRFDLYNAELFHDLLGHCDSGHGYWCGEHHLELLTQQTNKYSISKVIQQDGVTVVIFDDKSKSIARCGKDDEFDPEKGLLIALVKKAYGLNYESYNELLNMLPKPKEEPVKVSADGDKFKVGETVHHCGRIGVVVLPKGFKSGNFYGVRFITHYQGFHNLDGNIEDDNGFWCSEELLEKVK